jgi:hypothetical protein
VHCYAVDVGGTQDIAGGDAALELRLKVIFWQAGSGMAHDRADWTGSEAAGYWAFTAWAH